jgi:hypothetical protein
MLFAKLSQLFSNQAPCMPVPEIILEPGTILQLSENNEPAPG